MTGNIDQNRENQTEPTVFEDKCPYCSEDPVYYNTEKARNGEYRNVRVVEKFPLKVKIKCSCGSPARKKVVQ